MTRDEFEQLWCKNWRWGGIDYAHELGRFAVPCDCGEDDCLGWKMEHAENMTKEEIVTLPEDFQERAKNYVKSLRDVSS